MPINPNIAMGVQPMQIQNPMNQLAQYAQIQQGQQANQFGQMQMEEYKRARQEENQVRNYLSQGADLNSPEAQRALLGMGKSGMGLLTNLQAQKKNQIEQSKIESEALNSRAKLSRELLNEVTTPQEYLMWHVGNHKDPVLGPYLASRGITADSSMANIQKQLAQPGGFRRLMQQSALGADKFIERTTLSLKDAADLGDKQASRAQAERHFQAGQNAPVFNAEAGGWVTKPVNGVSGVIPVAGLDGGKPLTESQGNAVAYGMRMAETNKLLKELESTGLKDTGKIRAGVGGTVGAIPLIGESMSRGVDNIFNVLPSIAGGLSEDQQKTLAARVNFITASLRKESGASISPSEFISEEKKYFPAPGDTAAVIKQKQDARDTAIKAMKIQAGRGSKEIDKHLESLGKSDPAPTNKQGWALHVDAKGNKAYVGPNGQIEEVK